MSSDVAIVNIGLIELGEPSIPSLEGQQTRQIVAKGLYEHARRALLTEIDWRFATHTQDLARDVAEPTDNRYRYQYSLPTDPKLLKVQDVDPGGNYVIQGNKLLSNNTSEQMMYTADVSEPIMPPYFVMLLGLRMAVLMAIPLTKSRRRRGEMQILFDEYKPVARFTDASQQPNRAVEHQPFIDCRN